MRPQIRLIAEEKCCQVVSLQSSVSRNRRSDNKVPSRRVENVYSRNQQIPLAIASSTGEQSCPDSHHPDET
jgi:hypothetical protein